MNGRIDPGLPLNQAGIAQQTFGAEPGFRDSAERLTPPLQEIQQLDEPIGEGRRAMDLGERLVMAIPPRPWYEFLVDEFRDRVLDPLRRVLRR